MPQGGDNAARPTALMDAPPLNLFVSMGEAAGRLEAIRTREQRLNESGCQGRGSGLTGEVGYGVPDLVLPDRRCAGAGGMRRREWSRFDDEMPSAVLPVAGFAWFPTDRLRFAVRHDLSLIHI